MGRRPGGNGSNGEAWSNGESNGEASDILGNGEFSNGEGVSNG